MTNRQRDEQHVADFAAARAKGKAQRPTTLI
jgi:hypothetical protein